MAEGKFEMCSCGSLLLQEERQAMLCSVCIDEQATTEVAEQQEVRCTSCAEIFLEDEARNKCPNCGEEDTLVEVEVSVDLFDAIDRAELSRKLREKKGR